MLRTINIYNLIINVNICIIQLLRQFTPDTAVCVCVYVMIYFIVIKLVVSLVTFFPYFCDVSPRA